MVPAKKEQSTKNSNGANLGLSSNSGRQVRPPARAEREVRKERVSEPIFHRDSVDWMRRLSRGRIGVRYDGASK
jgi:hypothetical protein